MGWDQPPISFSCHQRQSRPSLTAIGRRRKHSAISSGLPNASNSVLLGYLIFLASPKPSAWGRESYLRMWAPVQRKALADPACSTMGKDGEPVLTNLGYSLAADIGLLTAKLILHQWILIMKVYEPLITNGYEWVNCCDDADYEVFLAWDGSQQGQRWNAVKVRRVRADERQEFKPSDFPWLGSHALVMRRRAVDALRNILVAHGEVLPLATEDVELYVFNARAIDALDEERSTIIRFPETNRIMRLKKVTFVEAAISDAEIFRLPHRASPTYVSQRFVDRVKDAGLVGLQFKNVWSSTEE